MIRSGEDGTIPDGWQMVRLGDVAEVVGGSTPSRTQDEYWGGDIPWVVPSELTQLSGRYLTSTKESITPTGMLAAGLRIIPEESILLTSRATIGAAAINAVPLTTNQGFQSLVPKCGTEGLWLYYSIASMRHALEKRSSGSTFREVSRDSVRMLPILLPPLREQRRIAAVLDAIDDAIERTDDAIAACKHLRDALLHDLLSHGVPGWHSEWRDVPGLGTIPADWEVVRLGDVAEVKSGVGFPLDRQGRTDGGYPFIKVSDMTLEGNETYIRSANNYVDVQDIDELGANVFTPGAIVFPKVGAAIATNKKRVLTVPTIIDNNMAGVTVTDAGRCTGSFLHFWFQSIDLFQFANVSAVPSITGSRLKRAFIPLPPLSEQQTTASMLDSTDKAIERAREERDGLRRLKASTADALLSGRIRVR